MPSLMVCCAVFSLLRSQARASGTSSPTCSLPRSCRLGRPSSTKMRSMSQSACFISPMDSLYSFLASLSKPQCLHAVVQEVLVDGRQLVLELGLQPGDDLCVALHGELLCCTWGTAPIAGRYRAGLSRVSASDQANPCYRALAAYEARSRLRAGCRRGCGVAALPCHISAQNSLFRPVAGWSSPQAWRPRMFT